MFEVNDRVQIPAHTDRWMAGDRFGTVVAVHPAPAYFLPAWVSVKLDKSGRTRRFIANDCAEVAS